MEDISETKYINDINNSNNIKKGNNINDFYLLKEIDKIINKSKIQLKEINLEKQNNFYECDKSINNNVINKTCNDNNIVSNNDNDSLTNIDINNNAQLNKIQNNPDIDKIFDLERINLQLTSDLTLERVKVRDLTLKLKIKDKEISSLKQQINYTQMNFYNKQKQFENFIKIINTDIKINKKDLIVKSLFNFFNKYIELFKHFNILKNDNYNNMILFVENDVKDKNIKNSKFIINTLDSLIQQLIKDNEKLNDQLMKYKDIENNNLDEKKDLKIIDNMKTKNNIFKEKLQKFINEKKSKKKDNEIIDEEILNNNNYQNENYKNINNCTNEDNKENKENKENVEKIKKDNEDIKENKKIENNKYNIKSDNKETIIDMEKSQNNNEIIANSLFETFGNINNIENNEKDINNIINFK